jgi:hypothetical protein
MMSERIKKHEEHMIKKRQFSAKEAQSIGSQLKIDWSQIDLEEFRRGLEVELEHGAIDLETNLTGDDLAITGKIAWAHLKEIRDYYTRLERMEAEAEEQLKKPAKN